MTTVLPILKAGKRLMVNEMGGIWYERLISWMWNLAWKVIILNKIWVMREKVSS